MASYRLICIAIFGLIIELFTAGDSYAAALLQPVPTGTFLPLKTGQAQSKENIQPLLTETSRFMPLTSNQMSKVLPTPSRIVTAPLSKSTAPLATLPSRSAARSTEISGMTEEEAQQILSLFSAYQ